MLNVLSEKKWQPQILKTLKSQAFSPNVVYQPNLSGQHKFYTLNQTTNIVIDLE